MSREHPSDTIPDEREPSLHDTLKAVHSMDSPTVTTTDIRILLGCSQSTARRRLTELFEEGELRRRDTGQQTLWWSTTPEEETPSLTDLEPVRGPKTNAVDLIEASEDSE